MSENLLYLCPAEFDVLPDAPSKLESTLYKGGFIGKAFDFNGETHYQPGSEFLSLITFLGCSPVIAMEQHENAGEGFSHIAFQGPSTTPQFVSGDNLKIPRCPVCGHRFDVWQPLVEAWRQQPKTNHITCPECSNELTLPQLRWRKSAGFGRYFIKIWGIFESEAVPSPELIALLEQVSGCQWQHFYVRYLG